MSAMGGMLMPGGWTMSMAWMRMPGQTWAGAAASWLGMWIVMMVAMMLPSLVPMLWRYREAVTSAAETRLGLLTALVGMGCRRTPAPPGDTACASASTAATTAAPASRRSCWSWVSWTCASWPS
jgi:predicted metal-binding membrane protein